MSVPEPTSSHMPVALGADLDAQMKAADIYSQSGLLPDTFRGKPANVLVAIGLAQAMDESLMTITGNLTMVGNKPGWETKFMRQRVRRFGHRIVETFDKATMTATCTIYRADDPKTPITVVMDQERAQLAGWWGKGYWAKDPVLMLENRAASACVRRACNEVLGGVTYAIDELRDETVSVTPIWPAPTPRDWRAEADAATTKDALAALWKEMHRTREATPQLVDHLKARKAQILAAEVVDAELIDPDTGEVHAPADAPADRAKRATVVAITRELVRCGVDAAAVDPYLPAFGIPRDHLIDLSQGEAEDLLAACRLLDRESLGALVRGESS